MPVMFGDEFTVNEEVTDDQIRSQVTVLSDGRVLFTWYSEAPDVDGSGTGISARIGTVQADGSIAWDSAGEFTVNEEVASTQEPPQVTVLSDGRVLFTWSSADFDVDGSGGGISARIGTVQADGSIAWGGAGELTVNEEVTNNQFEPQVTVLSDGRVLFTWYSADADVDGSGSGISARIGTVQADGSIAWGGAGEFTVNEEVTGSQSAPQVTVLSDGRVLFTWYSNDPDVDGSAFGISARIGTVQADGSIAWDSAGEFTVNEEVTNSQLFSQVTVLSDGRVLLTWNSNDPDVDGSGYGISGRVLLFNDAPLAADDAFEVDEDGVITGANLFADNGEGADTDPDADDLTITEVNGSAANVGGQITLASGALLTVNADGTFDYDQNGAFDLLGPGQTDTDSFTYTIDDGFGATDTATVTITINGANDAVAFGDEFTVNEEVTNSQFEPQVTVLSDGRVLFTWYSNDPDVDGSNSGISARIGTVQADGSIVWDAAGEITVNEEVTSAQALPQVTVLSDGRLLFTWMSFDSDVDGSDYGISARIGTVQADGGILWNAAGEFTVNENVSSAQGRPQVTEISAGRVLFTWESSDPGVDGDSYGISARIGTVQADGSVAWDAAGEFTVNEEVTSDQQYPQVTALGDGRVLFTWYGLDPDVDGSATGISARIGTVQADGSIVWSAAGEVTVNEEVTNGQGNPQVTVLGDGRVLFTWQSDDPDVDGSVHGISARVGTVQTDGSIVWGAAGEVTVNQQATSSQTHPQVTELSDGRVLFTWMSADPDVDGSSYGISARLGTVQADGDIVWDAAGEFTVNKEVTNDQVRPQVTVLSDGRVLITWQSNDPDVDGSDYGISGRVLLFNDAPLAADDAFEVDEDGVITGGNLFADNGEGADSDANDDELTISEVNGSAANVGAPILLASGALLTVNADGTFDYDQNGAFDLLGPGQTDTDSFTYTIDDGFGATDTATVTITINGANDAVAFGDEFTVNEEVTDNQIHSQIAVLSDGRVLFTWRSDDPDVDGSSSGISARIGTVQADGSIAWDSAGEFTVNEEVTDTQRAPQVTVLSDGRVLFTWQSADADVDGSGYGISTRIGTVQADGSIAWDSAGEFTVNEEVTNGQELPQVTVLSDGRVLFTWYSFDPDVDDSNSGISARIGTVQADGSIAWDSVGEFTVNEDVTSIQYNPQVTVLSDGRVLFTWYGYSPDVDGSDAGISARIGTVQADGSIAWGGAGEFTVNEEVTNNQVYPQVTVLSDGRVLFTWYSNDPDVDGSSYGISARIGTVQTDGSIAWGGAGELTVNEEVTTVQFEPQVTVLSDGRVLFTWSGDDPDVDGFGVGISARIGTVQADGSIAWDGAGEFTVNEEVTNSQDGPQVTVLDDGRVLITWQSNDSDVDGSGYGISGRVLLFNDTPLAADDAFAVDEDGVITGGNLFADNGDGADSDANDDDLTITEVNGSAANVGAPILLASGALLTVNADGTFSYDPNGAFTLGLDESDTDSFTYTIDDGFGGADTATVTITINSISQTHTAVVGPDNIDAGAGDDVIVATTATANTGDTFNGGDGLDTLSLVGGGFFLLTGVTLSSIERLAFGNTGASVQLNAGQIGAGLAADAELVGGAGVDQLTIMLTEPGTFSLGFDMSAWDVGDKVFVFGWSDADTITGGAITDIFHGNGGNDLLDGGGGVDTAVLDVASEDAAWHRNVDGTWTVTSAEGVDTLTSIEVLSFTDRDIVLDNAQQSFLGNGSSDIMWRNAITGEVTFWDVTGAAFNSGAVAGGIGPEWTIVGSGDISGDGRDDIVLQRDSDGLVAVWRDGNWASADFVGAAPSEWRIAAIGDFDFDGCDDFLWRNSSTGEITTWLMDGAQVTSQHVIGGAPAEWSIDGVGDFDGDGHDDILLRNSDGLLVRWTTDGTTPADVSIIMAVPTNWEIAGIGDFDGDGRADLVWRNMNDGGVAGWLMDGSTQLNAAMLGGAPLTWSIADVGDYNGDGRDDILWRNDDGTLALWTLNGLSVANQSIVAVVPTEWGII